MDIKTIVTVVFEGRQLENNLAQNLHEHFVRAVAKVKLTSDDGISVSGGSVFERIKRAKGAFDKDATQALLAPYEKHFEKSSELSIAFREKGNDLYKRKNLEGALRAYTLSLAFAPVKESQFNEELLLAYTNRSAVLLQKNKFTEALQDLERALTIFTNSTSGQPYKTIPNLKEKLLERKMKCEQAIEKLPKANRPSKAVEDDSGDEENKKNKLFKIEAPSKQIPNAESFVEVRYSENRGRHLVVTRDVPAGNILLVDQPFVSVLDNLLRWETNHCHNCCREVVNGIPCKDCCFALFCTENCLSLACATSSSTKKGGIHHLEHKYLPILHTLNSSHGEIQSLRILATVSKKELVTLSKNIKTTLKASSSSPSPSTKNEILPGFDNNGVYNVTSYLPIFHLISHSPCGSEETTEDLDDALILNAMKALFLTQLLKLYSNYFNGESKEFEDFVAGLILKQLESLKYNAICQSKLVTMDNGSKGKKAVPYAAAVYPLISLCNHSCDPNCVPVRMSKYLVTNLVALKHLKSGDEMFITYKPLYTTMKTSERQKFLAEGYRFICNCNACEMNWGPGMINQQQQQFKDNEGGNQAMLILQPTRCEKCSGGGEEGENIDNDDDKKKVNSKKVKQCHECALKDLGRAKNIQEMERILFDCYDVLMLEKEQKMENGVDENNEMECLKKLPEVVDYFGREGFLSYFPLYNVALDLFKRALLKGAAQL